MLSPVGAWAGTLNTIYNFVATTGTGPRSGIVFDKSGNIYGTTYYNGANGYGTIYELTPPTAEKQAWTETTIYNFDATTGNPVSGVVLDKSGNIYGTTSGTNGVPGIVFELTPPTAGKQAWTETTLFSFNGTNGQTPDGGVVFDSSGNLYGTTYIGGSHNNGIVYKLAPPAAGKKVWTETVLLNFDGTNGQNPYGGVVFDSSGKLYGTTYYGGSGNFGVIYQLTPPAAGKKAWTNTTIFNFKDTPEEYPYSGVVIASSGQLYGTISAGSGGNGSFYLLTPPAAGKKMWTKTVPVVFNGMNGSTPLGGIVFDKAGNLYGTTSGGGSVGYGTVFMYSPN